MRSGIDAARAGPAGRCSRTGRPWRRTRCWNARAVAVALVTTRGFADVIEIARQARPSLYDPFVDRPGAARAARAAVRGRWAARRVRTRGRAGRPARPARGSPTGVEEVAVCLLHADLNPEHERAVGAGARRAGLRRHVLARGVARSSGSTSGSSPRSRTRSLRPKCRPYLLRIEALAESVLVMTSAGGLVPVSVAAELPGRAVAERAGGRCAGRDDRGRIRGLPGRGVVRHGRDEHGRLPDPWGSARARSDARGRGASDALPVARHPHDRCRRWIDRPARRGRRTRGRVRRARARFPGPACYGLGGTEPTVTDADLVLGRIPAGTEFPGLGCARRRRGPARDRRRRAHRRGDRPRRRREHGASGAGRDRRARRRCA